MTIVPVEGKKNTSARFLKAVGEEQRITTQESSAVGKQSRQTLWNQVKNRKGGNFDPGNREFVYMVISDGFQASLGAGKNSQCRQDSTVRPFLKVIHIRLLPRSRFAFIAINILFLLNQFATIFVVTC